MPVDPAAAAALAQPLLEADQTVIGYWLADEVVILDVDPIAVNDALLVVENDEAAWVPYGPLNEDGDRWDDILEAESTPLDSPATAPADDSTAGAGTDAAARLRLLADALHGDEDTPADVLARVDADLAAAEGKKP